MSEDTRVLTKDQIQSLGEYLQGTCKPLQEGLGDLFGEEIEGVSEDMITEEEMEELEEITTRCMGCSWWVEGGSLDEDGMCEDCNE